MVFKAFYNDWLDCSGYINETGEDHRLNLSVDFFENLRFDSDSLKQYRIEAAARCAETLGERPALCLSGGIDSQAMVQCWKEAGLDFDVIICVFDNELNSQDADHAKMFCEKFNIAYKELTLNIIQFLTRENYLIAEKYKSYSPHFNTHYKMVELLADKGYTGVCFGGIYPFGDSLYGISFSGSHIHFLKCQHVFPIPCQGSFLSFFPALSWATSLNTARYRHSCLTGESFKELKKEDISTLRYQNKVKCFQATGFKIIPQSQKYTGFELVKKFFEKKSGDGWEFEKKFRHPIETMYYKDRKRYAIKIDSIILEKFRRISS